MSITDVGYVAVLLSLVVAFYSGVAAIVSARRGLEELEASARNGVFAIAGLLSVAGFLLFYAFFSHDFGVRYVYVNATRDMPWYLKLSAFWGGQEGSLLFWAWGLSIFTAVVIWQNLRRNREFMPYVIAVLMAIQGFFLVVLGFVSNPFERLPFSPLDGQGLNPLLRDAGMLGHPPFLLAGYMSWSIPFAFAIAALLTGKPGAEWIRAVRHYTLVAWAVLWIGLLFGAWWAYHVLGWGGYWGWDPVENVALMPWLMGTAFLHSIIVQERRGMLKVWNFVLIILTFALSIFGTFVVRSGVLSSVHAFAKSAIGPLFFLFLAVILVFSLALLFTRLSSLRSEQTFDALVSRESSFLLNNLLLVGITFAVFWGSILPLVSEAVRGVKLTVGPPFFIQVAGPLFLALMLLLGICPLLAWRAVTWATLWRNFRWLLLGTLVVAGVLPFVGVRNPWAIVAYSASAFALASIILEYYRGVRARRRFSGEGYPKALSTLVSRNKRRYGGYIIHLGVVIMAVGIIGSLMFQKVREATLSAGESMSIGGYTITYNGNAEVFMPGHQMIQAKLDVLQGEKKVGEMGPGKSIYRNYENQPVSRIAIRSGLGEDLYIVLAGYEGNSLATLTVFVNPLVAWVWIGGVVLLLGTLVAGWPELQARAVPVRRPVRRVVASEA